MDKDSIESSR